MEHILVPWLTIVMSFAIFGPIDTLENVVIRSAAGTIALGVLWRYVVKPVRDIAWRFFEDHHNAVESVREIKRDVVEIKSDIREVVRRQDVLDARVPEVQQ